MAADEEPTIKKIIARKVFNSRGELTLEVEVHTSKSVGRAAAPSGASKGKHEVVPFPTGGINEAIRRVKELVEPKLLGKSVLEQREIDEALHEIDGTENFSRIGGATALAISVAVANAAANSMNIPLAKYIGGGANQLPLPLGNVVGGGKHAPGKSIDVQEVLVIPTNPPSYFQAFLAVVKVHKEVGRKLKDEDPSFTGGRNDEGAWTTTLPLDKVLDIVARACEKVSAEVDFSIRIGLDVAASSLWNDAEQRYVYRFEGVRRTTEEQYEYISRLIDEYELVYVEDPFHEEDFASFAKLTIKYGSKALICGDDLFVTNADRLREGISASAANAIIIKPNQVGTLSDAIETTKLALENKITPVVSHRSGETTDDYIAHFAVAMEAPIIKTGVLGGERIAKHNELIRIEEFLGSDASIASLVQG